MKSPLLKILALGLSIPATLVAFFFLWQVNNVFKELPEVVVKHRPAPKEEAKADAHGEAPKADAHGEAPKADAHGGGHGEAKAEEHGGGHGEAKADEHGGGHGGAEADRKPASTGGVGLVSIDEIFVNIGQGEDIRSLGVKLELELFDEGQRAKLDKHLPGIKNSIIETSREQDFNRLNTIPGKLYFKETLVSRINQYFHEAVIRDIHFSSFFLQ